MAEQKDRVSEVAETKEKDKPQTKKTKKQKDRKKSSFFKDLKSEMKKITWYSRKETLKSSLLVMVIIVVFATVLGLVDWGLNSLMSLLATIV